MGDLQPFSAEKHTILLAMPDARRKLFKVQFQKTNGSFFVHLPYYRQCDGLVALVTLGPGDGGPAKVDLGRCGKVTSQRVKYSHHPDGHTSFSQDSRVISEIKRKATPLEGFSGHVFTLQLQGPDGFEPLASETRLRKSSHELDHLLRPREPAQAFKFVGEWVGADRFRPQLDKANVGPFVQAGDGVEKPELAMLLGPREGAPPKDRLLLLTCEAIAPFNESGDSCVFLIGGFDPSATAGDPEQQTSFLALLYPASDPKILRQQVGTIDFGG